MAPIRIAGTGSAIADYLYDHVDFHGEAFRKYASKIPGDGGLEPGKLVLTEDFEAFAGTSVETALAELVGGLKPTSFNLGGPAIAALINTAQMLETREAEVSFYAANGTDEAGKRLRKILEQTPVDSRAFRDMHGSSPYTLVLSDPTYHGDSGERTFLNNIGSSFKMRPEDLDSHFYEADVRLFGGTALVPPIHEALTSLLKRARETGNGNNLSVVSTVYDFPNEKRNPDGHWPLGESLESYRLMDLLVVDHEEALRLAGVSDLDAAVREFQRRGLKALIVTRGVDDVLVWSGGGRFAPVEAMIPISRTDLTDRGDVPWDTTGCGDNFVGAVLYSLASQLADGRGQLDLTEACGWGVCAGDFACYYIGGTYLEKHPGEKMERITSIHDRYVEAYHA